MEIGEISEGINETGKKTTERVLCDELLCCHFVRTYDKYSVNCLLTFLLDCTHFLILRPHLGKQNSGRKSCSLYVLPGTAEWCDVRDRNSSSQEF
jgi:hypothetical protein